MKDLPHPFHCDRSAENLARLTVLEARIILFLFINLITLPVEFGFRYAYLPQLPIAEHLLGFLMGTVYTVSIALGLHLMDRKLEKFMPYNANFLRRIGLQVSISFAVVFLLQLVGMSLVESMRMGDILKRMGLNELSLILIRALDYIFVLTLNMMFFLSHFMVAWKDSLIRAERLQRESAHVRFDALRNQLNPHFLFNSLNSLNSLIYDDQKLASQFLQQLSRVYRYVLQNKDKELVSLNTEAEFIQNYISLLKTRFGEALRITLTISPEKGEVLIVPVTLQIMIENAIKHNMATQQQPLEVSVFVEGEELLIRNNLQRKSQIEHSNKQGLSNLRALYAYITSKPVRVVETPNTFTVCIPLIHP